MVDIKILRQLIQLMKANDLTELDIRDKEDQITLKRGANPLVGPVVMHAPASMVAPVPAGAPAPAAAAAALPSAAAADAEEGLHKITSPMVGSFYASPSPDAESYVKIGSAIGPDTVVCIIEAMKVFNEIKAECSGTLVKVLVSNGQAVEFGQPLFLVKPG